MRTTAAQRLANYTWKNQKTGCWDYTGPTNDDGYGLISYTREDGSRTSTTAHRLAYQLVHGPVPPSTVIRHTCDNRRCVNPEHLVAGSQADNMEDMYERGRDNPQRGGISLAERSARRAAAANGLTAYQIAKRFNIKLRTAMRWRQKHRPQAD